MRIVSRGLAGRSLAALSLLALAGAGCRAAMPARPSDPVGSSRPAAAIEPAPSPPIAAPAAPSPPPPLSAAAAAAILRVRGAEIVDGAGQPIQLRGVAFGNEVWGNVRLPRRHHGEVDYQRVAAMGMNVVRFYMNHRTFEGSRPAASAGAAYLPDGWQWIDDNVAWARRNGVRLVLNMHVPPGGFQSLGAGKALWDDPITQDRLIQLWTAIAARYRGESTIAGYDLLNEPVTTRSKDQWRELAGRLARAIRRVDPEHMLFVERLNAVAGDWAEDADRNFFTIDDPNTVYEFHFYKPFHFTHQMASWVPFTAEDVRYPDARAEVEWFLLDRKGGTDASPKLPPGDTPWTFYEGAPFRVDDPTIVVGKPVLMVKGNSGTVFFDDLVLEQLDEAGQVKRVIWKRNLTSNRGWFLWSKDGSGGAVPGHSGHGDDASLVAAGTRGDANLGSDVLRFRTEPGATYRLSGWMRGQKIPPEAVCQIRLDFFSSRVPVQSSDRAFLTQEIDAYVEWGRRHQVPLFLGEFGVIRFAFDDDRGGLRWVSDLLDILAERRLHFSYHAYHDDGFGLYRGAALPNPDSANRALIDLFTRKLAPAAPAAVATPPPPPVRAGGA